MTLDKILDERLKIQAAARPGAADLSFLVIDVSGSMDGKRLPDSEVVWEFVPDRHEHVKLWSDFLRNAEPEPWRRLSSPGARIEGKEVENGVALMSFARDLPQEAKITLITDDGGLTHVLGHGAVRESHPEDARYQFSISGRPLQIITL